MGASTPVFREFTHPDRDWALLGFALEHLGVVSLAELIELGFDFNAIARRVAAGRLFELWPHVYAVGLPSLSRLGRYRAAVLTCGKGAVLSHQSAADLGAIRSDNRAWIDVSIPHARTRIERSKIRIHRPRALEPDDITKIHGIPVTSLARTLADLTTCIRPDSLAKAIDTAERKDLLDMSSFDALFARAPRREESRRLQGALSHYAPPHTKSELEEKHRLLIDEYALPRPHFNTTLEGETADYEVDAHWPDDRLVVDLDGWQHHKTHADRARDAAKTSDLELAGHRVLRLIWADFVVRPDKTARRIRLLTPNSA